MKPTRIRAVNVMGRRTCLGWWRSGAGTAIGAAMVILSASAGLRAQQPAGGADSSAATADVDRITLDTGKVLEGQIVEFMPGDRVVMELEDGRRPTITWSLVKKVESKRYRMPAPGSASTAPTIPPATSEQPSNRRDKGNGTSVELGEQGLSVSGTFHDAEERRQSWMKRGGEIASYEVRLQATGILFPKRELPGMPVVCYANGMPTVTQTSGTSTRDGGGGGGAGLRVAWMHLNAPNPETGSGFFAVRAGPGFDFAYNYFAVSSLNPPQGRACSEIRGQSIPLQTQGYGMMLMQVPMTLGFSVGVGGFRGDSKWRGVVLSAAWTPTYSYVKPSEGDGTGSFAYTGFELSFDITSMEAAVGRYAQEAQFRFSAFVLPPVKKDFPLIGTLGFGAVWY